ncbi:hypothetical protein [Sinosporangium siamense]|uniref:Uncharacterized protein n=1 Tax=Sinosporangium siamense TaxID=1367973 RepID=A0A919VAU5_9ACTN|nr:hypothetical protein [Sinosporangium siamense]GII95777.1 hypothetical protein Ssi02_60080 [Sinosporangium siamense]
MTDHRKALTNGLRDLADFLDSNPGIPVPLHGVPIHYFPPTADDAEMTAAIDQIASLLGSPVSQDYHYKTGIPFGPVVYEAIAVFAAKRAQYEADSTYFGCVTPDNADAAAQSHPKSDRDGATGRDRNRIRSR